MSEPDGRPAHDPGSRRDAVETVTWPVRIAAAWTWRLLIIGLGLLVLGRIFQRIELVAVSFVLALFFTAVLHPLELLLRRIPGPRSLSAALALLIGLAVLVGIGWFVTWQITTHATELGDQINDFVNKTRNWLRTGPLHLKSSDLDRIANDITNAISSHSSQIVSGAIKTVRTVVELIGAILLILLSTFFLLRDGDRIWEWTLRLFPRAAQARVDVAGRTGWHTFGGYMRGQVIIALFHGVSVMIVLFILRVPLAAALGVLIFLGSFVPLLGLTVTGAIAVAVALLEHGVTGAIAVAIAIVVLVQLEAHLLQPLIMSRSVAIHPLAVALAVVTGTLLAGIVGALLAVPFVAFVNSTVHALRETVPPEADRSDALAVDASEPDTAGVDASDADTSDADTSDAETSDAAEGQNPSADP